MTRRLVLLGMVVAAAGAVVAQEAGTRAWQQRLDVDIQLPVPLVELPATNPFAVIVDAPPRLVRSQPPRKVDVRGRATAATYVDARGESRGVVPLDLPFPGLAAILTREITDSKFDPARRGTTDVAAWAVIEVSIEGRVKESVVVDQALVMPDPDGPSRPTVQEITAPPGNLGSLPFTPLAELSSPPLPRRLRLRVGSRDLETPIRILVHVTAEGRADRYVPLDFEPGLDAWLSAFLATWRLDPAQRDGLAVDCWVVYSCRAKLEMSTLESASFRVLRNRQFTPGGGAQAG